MKRKAQALLISGVIFLVIAVLGFLATVWVVAVTAGTYDLSNVFMASIATSIVLGIVGGVLVALSEDQK